MQPSASIRSSLVTPTLRGVIEAVGAGTAALIDITGANISLAEKQVLLAVRAGTATRVSVMASAIPEPVKELILASSAAKLTGVASVGAVGTVTPA